MRRLPFVLLTGVGLTISANIADAKLMRGPAEVGRSAAEGARELARAQRSQRNTAEARESLRGNTERYLLANPFEEECFNPGKDEVPFSQFQIFAQTSELPRLWDDEDMRDSYEFSLGRTKQRFKSCGQFNNVLQLLLHALAVARILDRTLIMPGFYFRKGLRRTRIDHFEEEWYPSSHFINTTKLKDAGYKTIELEEFKRRWWAKQDLDADELIAASGTDGGWRAAPLKLPRVYIRGLGEQGPRLENFNEFGLQFEEYKFVEFPFAFQQQSAARWVDGSSPAHNGRYSVWQLGELERWWRNTMDFSEMAYQPVLAFDSAVSFGFGMDGLRFDPALAQINTALHYVDSVGEKSRRFISDTFGTENFLAVHIRRGVDRLTWYEFCRHEFCKSNEGKECYGWKVKLETMCYPAVADVAAKIHGMLKQHKLRRVFLATDSPDPRVFEDILRDQHGLDLVRAFPDPTARHVDEWSLLVDQAVCANPQAKAFLGNFPSTVTVSILQQRDAHGISRKTFDFFGSNKKHRKFFRSSKSEPIALNTGESGVHDHMEQREEYERRQGQAKEEPLEKLDENVAEREL